MKFNKYLNFNQFLFLNISLIISKKMFIIIYKLNLTTNQVDKFQSLLNEQSTKENMNNIRDTEK